jgi:DNA repair photolyase
MMAPLIPGISDTSESIDAAMAAAARHKAGFVSANLLFLKPGCKEWFMPLIREAYPHLMPGYKKLFGPKDYAPREYTRQVLSMVEEARRRWELPSACPPRDSRGPSGQLEMVLTA